MIENKPGDELWSDVTPEKAFEEPVGRRLTGYCANKRSRQNDWN